MASADVSASKSGPDISVSATPDESLPKVKSTESLSKTQNGCRKSSPTVTVISALKNKYSTSSMQSVHCEIFITSNAPGKTESGNFRVPESLTLDSCKITAAGRKQDIAQLCSGVQELDLTSNKISSWSEVWNLLQVIPNLRFLNLTKNPLEQHDDQHEQCYADVRKLALNFTNLTWTSVNNLLNNMPYLTELYLSGNSYVDVMLDNRPAYETLTLLQLTSNCLTDWSQVAKLDRVFPQLQNLILAHNDIVRCGSVEENSKLFKHLEVLNMNNTNINEWNELDSLGALQSLSDVRLSSIPLVESFDELKRRQMLVVYFPHVNRLNGSTMSPSERETAERVYIRHFQDLPDKPNRYAQLLKKHGTLDPLASVDLKPADTVAMVVVCGDKKELFDIPTKQTIGQLRRSLRNFVGCKKFRIYHDAHLPGGPVIVIATNRFVYSLNFQDGDLLTCVPSEPLNTDDASKENESDNSNPPSPIKEPSAKKRL